MPVTRLPSLLCTAVLLLVLLAVGGTAGARADEAGYWAFAARRAQDLESSWAQDRGVFLVHEDGVNSRLNANMLELYALAALHDRPPGPERRDDRARSIVDHFLHAPAYVSGAPPKSRGGEPAEPHSPGWDSGTDYEVGRQHVSLDPQVAAALAAAYRARDALGLSDDEVAQIADHVDRVARSPFYRYPAIELGQFNWPAAMYGADHEVTGAGDLLTGDYRRQLVRFLSQARSGSPRHAAPLTAGLGLHYIPGRPTSLPSNRTSTSEYGNIVFSGLDEYDAALAAGMRPLAAGQLRLLRAWAQRVLYGEWTHAGYLNWDTGLGSNRWHLQRYWPLALAGPLTLATSTQLAGPTLRARAGWILDRAMTLYEQRTRAYPRSLLPSRLFGLQGHDGSQANDPELIASRFGLLAAEAADRGLGAAPKAEPPAFYALDADIGRLAVSTPVYSTALIQPQPTLGYGGLEPARIFGADGNPLTGIGGAHAAALSLAVRTRSGLTLDTQPGRRWTGRTIVRRWRLHHRGPRGTFTSLLARSWVRRGRIRIVIGHRFLPDRIRTSWDIDAPGGSTVRLSLPIWSPHPAATRACTGSVSHCRTVRTRPRVLHGHTVHVRVQHGGYVATISGGHGARVQIARLRATRSSPFTRRAVTVTLRMPKSGRMTLRRTLTFVTPG